MRKLLLGGLLAFALLLLPLSGSASAATFSDVSGHWAQGDIEVFSDLGLVNGKAPGVFAPSENVTRAEFTAILNRAFPDALESRGVAPDFLDVPSDAWFYADVTKAAEAGLAKGSEGLFHPYDSITRQDAAVLLQRYLTGSGLRSYFPDEPEYNFKDADSISDYAVTPIDFLKHLKIVKGYNGSGFMPQSFISRAESVVLANRSYQLLNRDVCSIEDFMTRLDGSTVTVPLSRVLLLDQHGFFSSRFGMSAVYFIYHSKTDEAIKNVISGDKDLALVTYPSDENLKLAKQKGVELTIVPIVNDAFVFMVNKDNPIESLTTQQVKDIYSGKITNWSEVGGLDMEILPLQRNADSGSQSGMIDFMGDTPIEVPFEDGDIVYGMGFLIDRVTEEPGAIGYSYYYYANDMYESSAKLIALDGISPTNESIAEGSYSVVTQYYALFRASEPEGSFARKLTDHIRSPEGQARAERLGYVKLTSAQIAPLAEPVGTPLQTTAMPFSIDGVQYQTVTNSDTFNMLSDISWMTYSRTATQEFVHSLELTSPVQRVAEGYSDVALATRPAQSLLDQAAAQGTELELVPYIADSIVFFVHPDNPVKNLTTAQLRDIYSRKITNWKEVGGIDAPIGFYLHHTWENMHQGPGRHVWAYLGFSNFESKEGFLTPDSFMKEGANLIGYCFYSDFVGQISYLEIDSIAPTHKKYPLRIEYYSIFRKSEPEGSFARNFTKYLLSREGQETITRYDRYFPIR